MNRPLALNYPRRASAESLEPRLVFDGSYGYWVPFVESAVAGPSFTENRVKLIAEENNTTVGIDFNHDGVADVTKIVNAGQQLTLGGPHNALGADFPGLVAGTRVTSDHPLAARYDFWMSDNGVYEDGRLSYPLPTAATSGSEFWLPFAARDTAVLATADGTQVQVDGDGDGVPERTVTLGYGQTTTLKDLPAGARLSASRDVAVVAAVYSDGYYDNTYAVTLLPTSLWQTRFSIPASHPYNQPSQTDYSRLLVVAGQDQTTITVNGTSFTRDRGQILSLNLSAESQVQSSAPVYAVYVSDVQGTDPWAGQSRHYVYAYNVPGSATVVKEAAALFYEAANGHGGPYERLAIAGFSAGTHVAVDIGADGTVDRNLTLDAGGFLYLDDRDPALQTTVVKVTADAGIGVVYSSRGWWNGVSESVLGSDFLPQAAGTDGTGGPGSVSGVFFNDLNANGSRDAGEPAMSGWVAYADLNKNGVLDPGEPASDASGADGRYIIPNLAPGTYWVYEDRKPGWTRTRPAGAYPLGYYDVTVPAGKDSPNHDFGDIPPVAWGVKVSQAFKAKVFSLSRTLSIDPNQLMAVMAWATGETFSPTFTNKKTGGVGLFQFTAPAASKLGTSLPALKAMTAEKQLDFVAKYLAPYKGKLHTLADVQMAALLPAAVGKASGYVLFKKGTAAYQQNAALDLNNDGIVTKGEATSKATAELNKGLLASLIG